MRKRFLMPGALGFAAMVVAAACGGTTTSDGQTDDATGHPAASGGNGAGGSGGAASTAVGLGGRTHIATGGSGECVPIALTVELPPLNLVFIVDRSASMGDADDAGAMRWIPVQAGLTAFLSQPVSSWIDASLELFPAADDLATACEASNYAVPTVPLLSLATLTPELSPFQLAMDATTPSGGTPTLPALLGTLDYARYVQSDDPDSTTAVVLVTGGLPGVRSSQTGELEPGCIEPVENTIAGVTAVAAEGLADGIPTYVIGVDDASELGELDEVALAGGTRSAAFIESEDAATMAARLQEELTAISAQHSPCTLELPDSDDEALPLSEYDDLAVVATVDGIPNGVPRSPGCPTDEGWQFLFMGRNSGIPSHIEFCPTTCQTLHATADVEITVEFPCGTLIP